MIGVGGKEKPDYASRKSSSRTGSSPRHEDLADAETDDDSDDDEYPLVSMAPIESDEEPGPKESDEEPQSDEEPLTDHFDDDESPPSRRPPVLKQNFPQQHRGYGSPVHGRTSNDQQYQHMKQC